MLPVSPGFLTAWAGGGTRVRRAYVRQGRSGAWTEVELVSYDINAASGENVGARYSGSVTLAASAVDLIDEQATYVQVRAGFVVDGVPELVPVGTMFVDEVEEARDSVELTCYSDEELVKRAEFRAPYTIADGVAVTSIRELLSVVTSTVEVATSRDAPVPKTTYDRDRWAAVQGCARAADVQVYVGPDGVWYVRDAPALAVTPVVSLGPGRARIGRTQKRSRRGVNNVVVVTGDRVDAEGEPPYGVWEDANPASPTYVGGVFGESVRHIGSPILTTSDACAKAAATYGLTSVGRVRQVLVRSAPLDPLEPADTISVERGDGTYERLIVDGVPHRSRGEQSLTTREVRE